MMTAATQKRDQLNAESTKLQATYSMNEVRINQLNNQLRDKAMALGLAEIFGLARSGLPDFDRDVLVVEAEFARDPQHAKRAGAGDAVDAQ